MNQVHKERLLRLADFLETIPPERFDLSIWVGEDWKLATDLSCGTTACALGWATTVPEFQALGLVLIPRGEVSTTLRGGFIGLRDSKLVHKFDRVDEAIAVVFGLDSQQAAKLFYPAAYGESESDDDDDRPADVYPSEVSSAIRRFVATVEVQP